jgi:hypothetical protein
MSEQNMGDALKSFLQKSKLKSGIKALQIDQVWEEIMGKTVAKYTTKLEIVSRTLYIITPVGPLKQELLYQREKIIQRVNEAMGEKVIDNVVIR